MAYESVILEIQILNQHQVLGMNVDSESIFYQVSDENSL